MNLIPAESTFTGRVTFDNLSAAEIGGLVAALDPRLLWMTEEVVTSVGGGKPFGFGSVTILVAVERLDSAASRYLGTRSGDLPSLSQCVKEFRAGWHQDAIEQRALRHALTLGYVEDADVWYPPGSGSKGEASYDQSFEFFQMTTGLETKDEKRRLAPLPSPLDASEAQVVRPNVEYKPRGGR